MRNGIYACMAVALMALVLLGWASPAWADQSVEADGSAVLAGGIAPAGDSLALKDARRSAGEKLCPYIAEYFSARGIRLGDGELALITDEVMEATVLEKQTTVAENEVRYWCRIKAVTSAVRLDRLVARLGEKTIIAEYRRIQDAYTDNSRQMDALKARWDAAKDLERDTLRTAIAENEKAFDVIQRTDAGYRYYLNDEFSAAADAYTLAVALDPRNIPAHFYRGMAYYRLARYDDAIADYSKALELGRQDAELFNRRAGAYYLTGRYDLAAADYGRIIAISPGYGFVYLQRGIVQCAAGRLDAGIADFNRAAALISDQAMVYWLRGIAYYQMKQFNRAGVDFDRAVKLDPQSSLGFKLRGDVFFRQGSYTQAMMDYGQAVSLNPHYSRAYFNRGVAALKAGIPTEAAAAWRQFAMIADPQDVPYLPVVQKRLQQLGYAMPEPGDGLTGPVDVLYPVWIDWDKGIIRTAGIGRAPDGITAPAIANILAKRAAAIVAERNMIQILTALDNSRKTPVSAEDIIAGGDLAYGLLLTGDADMRVSGTLTGQRIVKEEPLADGSWRVIMEYSDAKYFAKSEQ